MDYITHCHIPSWFMMEKYTNVNGKTTFVGIAEFEIIATILGATIIASLPISVRACVNLCIDNNIALHAIISGNSKTDMRARLAQIFWRVNLCSNAIFWMEFVPSAANNGDAPSRSGSCAGLNRASTVGERVVEPPVLFKRIFYSAQSFEMCVNGHLPSNFSEVYKEECIVPKHLKTSFV